MERRPATGIRRWMRIVAFVALLTALAHGAAPGIAPAGDAGGSGGHTTELTWMAPHVGAAARHLATAPTVRLTVALAAVTAAIVLFGLGVVLAPTDRSRSSGCVERWSPRRGPPAPI
jgi:hypothetical protein